LTAITGAVISMLEDYFDLQLKFAERYAFVAGMSFDLAIGQCTNLRRRLNLSGPEGADRWEGLLARIKSAGGDPAAARSACMALFESRPCIARPRSFGCFSHDGPDQAGVLRIHFMPPQDTKESPLAAANAATRRDELRALFSQLRRTGGHVTSVRGVSWLYNLDAYKRLFPPAYRESVRLPWFAVHLTGSSTWGQVLNWRQEIKPGLRDTVLARLSALKKEAPWEIFPLRARVATCDIRHFHDWFA
jgi:hypothetical protein